MKLKIHTCSAVVFLVVLFIMQAVSPAASIAQSDFFTFGPGSTFDWSDYRGGASARVFFGRLASLGLDGIREGLDTSLKPIDVTNLMKDDFQITQDFTGILWIDRLGIRGQFEQREFRGRHLSPTPGFPNFLSELNLSTSRFGFDLDLIRYPFIRAGANLDLGIQQFMLTYWQPEGSVTYRSTIPMTIGVHAAAIPFRIKEVPLYVQARGRFPFPGLEQISQAFVKNSHFGEARMLDWEISGGFRPAVWETSSFGHSTYSVSIEAGFRSLAVETPLRLVRDNATVQNAQYPSIQLKTHWQGAFFQVMAFF